MVPLTGRGGIVLSLCPPTPTPTPRAASFRGASFKETALRAGPAVCKQSRHGGPARRPKGGQRKGRKGALGFPLRSPVPMATRALVCSPRHANERAHKSPKDSKPPLSWLLREGPAEDGQRVVLPVLLPADCGARPITKHLKAGVVPGETLEEHRQVRS